MTKIQQIIADAKAAGFEVIEDSHCTRIIAQRHKGRGTVLCGLAIYENGVAVDLTVRNDLAVAIRSTAAMRKALGL